MNIVDFEDKDGEIVPQLVLDIPPGRNYYDYVGSGIKVEIIGKGHIIRNAEDNRKEADEMFVWGNKKRKPEE
tara:strand:- start:606 stop:821 length:216 start_codon:yes stop_codon:yes gene_type:complete